MARVMTTNGSAGCGHGGSAQLSSSAKLKVSGAAVLLAGDVTSWTIKPGCSQTNSQGGEKICTSITSQTAGKSSKLKVDGQAVVLDSFAGLTDGSPKQDTASASAGQSKLSAL
jgi:hypothetical protein